MHFIVASDIISSWKHCWQWCVEQQYKRITLPVLWKIQFIPLQRTLYAYIILLAVIRNLHIIYLYEPSDIKLLVQPRKCKHYKIFCTSVVLGIMHCLLPRLKWLYEHGSVTLYVHCLSCFCLAVIMVHKEVSMSKHKVCCDIEGNCHWTIQFVKLLQEMLQVLEGSQRVVRIFRWKLLWGEDM